MKIGLLNWEKMTTTLIISALTCGLMLVVVLKKPSVSISIKNKNFSVGTYWIVALIGAVALIVARSVSLGQVWRGITADTAINPIKILALFISMTALSVFLDEMGFFAYLAAKSVSGAKGQKSFFVKLFILVSVLTVFTSNDVIILTFTPFICCYAKNAGVNPVPYLVSEFVAANTFSLTFIIGNPTNIYLATFCGISFGKYFSVMVIPALLAGLTGFAVTYLVFRRQLSQPLQKTEAQAEIKDKPLLAVGLVALSSCTVLLAVSSYLGFEMWLISVVFALALIVVATVYSLIRGKKPAAVGKTLCRLPFELVPFVLSMFAIVLALDLHGVTEKIAMILDQGYASGLTYGLGSVVFANLINNIPMSVLFGAVTAYAPSHTALAVYSAIIGSNIGAFLTPVGALAGIMWLNILKEKEVKFTFRDFVKYGVVLALPVLAAAVGGLYLMLAVL